MHLVELVNVASASPAIWCTVQIIWIIRCSLRIFCATFYILQNGMLFYSKLPCIALLLMLAFIFLVFPYSFLFWHRVVFIFLLLYYRALCLRNDAIHIVKRLWFTSFTFYAHFSCLQNFRFNFITYYNAIKYNKIKYSVRSMGEAKD